MASRLYQKRKDAARAAVAIDSSPLIGHPAPGLLRPERVAEGRVGRGTVEGVVVLLDRSGSPCFPLPYGLARERP